MRITCLKCGGIVCNGEVVENKKHKNRFYMTGKINGEIYKNKSNNPNQWNGKCSKCQKIKE